jgi:hypothetical protein
MTSDADRDPPLGEPLLTRAAPYPTSRLGARIELVDLAMEIEKADHALGMVASAKLETIRDQMIALQRQARRVLEEARASARLHRARCTFKKIPGKTYHLYRGEGDEPYFSMLSPDDWKGSPPHPFEGSFRLEADLHWTPMDAAVDRPDPRLLVQQILEEDVE